MNSIRNWLILGYVVLAVSGASIVDNLVDTPRIKSSEDLLSSIVNDCFDGETMSCLKGKVLTYLDSVLQLKEESARSFQDSSIDEVIYTRLARILSTNELKVTLPETIFQKAVISYRPDNGLDINLPEPSAEEGRGDMLKKKLLLPVLLLLKLKFKALLPIFVALIGIKAMKALVLSKLAITIVLGFVIYNLVKKNGMASMAMMPMAGESPMMTSYGAPAPTSAPSSSYENSWDASNGGPYSRVWEPSSSQSLAYSGYYPSSSSSSSNSGSSSGATSTSHSSYSA